MKEEAQKSVRQTVMQRTRMCNREASLGYTGAEALETRGKPCRPFRSCRDGPLLHVNIDLSTDKSMRGCLHPRESLEMAKSIAFAATIRRAQAASAAEEDL